MSALTTVMHSAIASSPREDLAGRELLRRIAAMREVPDDAVVALREAIRELRTADIRPAGLLEELEAALQLSLRKPPMIVCTALHFETGMESGRRRAHVPREYPDDLTAADFG